MCRAWFAQLVCLTPACLTGETMTLPRTPTEWQTRLNEEGALRGASTSITARAWFSVSRGVQTSRLQWPEQKHSLGGVFMKMVEHTKKPYFPSISPYLLAMMTTGWRFWGFAVEIGSYTLRLGHAVK